jgi:hypothetical protein
MGISVSREAAASILRLKHRGLEFPQKICAYLPKYTALQQKYNNLSGRGSLSPLLEMCYFFPL